MPAQVRVNATAPAILFVTLMVTCLLTCYLIAVTREDVQAWIPYISDLGVRGPEHFVFAQLLNMAAYVGIAMMLLRFITVADRTNNVCTRRVNWFSLIVGSLATVFLSFVANFPEGQSHGIGHTHTTGAGVVFTAGCLFIVVDTFITLRMRAGLRQWRWFERIRPIVAVLSVVSWILALTGSFVSKEELKARAGNTTLIVPYPWTADEPGYAMHVQGAVCEWLVGILFIVYSLLLLPEFLPFTIHVTLEPVVQNEVHRNGVHQREEYPPLLQH